MMSKNAKRQISSSRLVWLILGILLISFSLISIANAATVNPDPLANLQAYPGMKWYTVDIPPSMEPFVGFTADIDKSGNQTIHVFKRPEDLAAVLGLRADQVLPSNSSGDQSMTKKESVKAQK